MVEAFLDAPAKTHPVIAEVAGHFLTRADDIQNGGSEFCHAATWLDICGPTTNTCSSIFQSQGVCRSSMMKPDRYSAL